MYQVINMSGTFCDNKNNIKGKFSDLSLLPEKIIVVTKIIFGIDYIGTSSLTYQGHSVII